MGFLQIVHLFEAWDGLLLGYFINIYIGQLFMYETVISIFHVLIVHFEYIWSNFMLQNSLSIPSFNLQVKEVIISFFILMEQGKATRQVCIS